MEGDGEIWETCLDMEIDNVAWIIHLLCCCVCYFFYHVQVESVSVADFVREGENLAKLHSDMVECDSSLAEMETMLMGFTRRLAELSDDIRRLQHGTSAAAARVTNRSAAEAHLSAFIDEIILPPNVIKLIVENEVGTERYVKNSSTALRQHHQFPPLLPPSSPTND